MMEHKPATKQRSPWVLADSIIIGPTVAKVFVRNVHDGELSAIVAEEPQIGWHLSISHRRRYPSWDEIAHARYELLPGDLGFVMHLPPMAEYVAVHDNCFHLYQHPGPT